MKKFILGTEYNLNTLEGMNAVGALIDNAQVREAKHIALTLLSVIGVSHVHHSLDDNEKCVIRWGVEDVLMQAGGLDEDGMIDESIKFNEDGEPVPTIADCLNILSEMERRHDACHGISWETIDVYIDMWRDELKKEQSK